jgi:hypothetical protein
MYDVLYSQRSHQHVSADTVAIFRVKVKVSRNGPGQAQGVPGGLSPRIFLTFGTTRVVGRQPYAPAAFTPGEILGTHF